MSEIDLASIIFGISDCRLNRECPKNVSLFNRRTRHVFFNAVGENDCWLTQKRQEKK